MEYDLASPPGSIPFRRGDQSVRRLRRPRRARLARLRARYDDIGRLDLIPRPRKATAPPTTRVPKQPDVLMLLYLLSAEDLRPHAPAAGISTGQGCCKAHGGVLPGQDEPRLDAERPICSLAVGPSRPYPIMVAVQRGARQRPGRHPTRHDPRGHSPWSHGRHRGPVAALLHRPGDPRRGSGCTRPFLRSWVGSGSR